MITTSPGQVNALNYVWDTGLLEWVVQTQSGGGGGGTVDQGTGGVSPWLVTGPLTDAELRASAVPVTAAEYIMQFDPASDPLLYLGLAAPGSSTASAVWQITRYDVTSGVIALYADGNTSFDNVWNNRGSLSYS